MIPFTNTIMNPWLVLILLIILVSFSLEFFISLLNLRALVPALPEEFRDIYDEEEYEKSQKYTKATTSFSLINSSLSTLLTVLFLLLGGFGFVDTWARNFGYGEIVTGLIFTGGLALLSFVVSLPFSVYRTFVIEERFGFNRTTVKTFLLDLIKGGLLAILIGAPLLSLILWFFINTGSYGWLYCWAGVVCFTLVLQFLAPVLIMPLFNKFYPLEEGELRELIITYAKQQNFKLQGIFTMDGSKRSSKLNAFFTGFGRFRKIVFFDTLVEKLKPTEILGVLAHEMGHFKLKHIPKMMAASILQTGIMFYLLSLFLGNENIALAFGVAEVSVYSSLVFFGFLYSPISLLVSILFNILSRKHEYEADNFAAKTTNRPEQLIAGLKRLSQANLSNLTPHPLIVFIHYSHPPVLDRINNLRNFNSRAGESASRQKA